MSLRLGLGLPLVPSAARPTPTTAPVNTVLPSITGVLTQGQTLTANPGSWTGLPSGSYAYQWQRSGANIGGATNSTYVAQAADVSAGASAITVEVTATNIIGSTTAESAGVTIAALLAITGTPGAPSVGAAYTFTPSSTGGHTPKTYALTGTLPAGLSFNTSTGAITGTPTTSGTAAGLNITVTDANGLTAALGTFSLVVSAISSYAGFVSVGGRSLDSATTSTKQYNSRSPQIATDNIQNSVRIALSNVRIIAGATSEQGNGAALTVKASIEYPAGTFTRVVWPSAVQVGGDPNTASIPSAGIIISDPVNLPVMIPDGAVFWVLIFGTSATGYHFTANASSIGVPKVQAAASGLTDQTLTGTITDSFAGGVDIPPYAVIAPTTKPSVLLIGDSIQFGTAVVGTSSTRNGYGRRGIIEPAIPATVAAVNIGAYGTTVFGNGATYISRTPARAVLFPFGSVGIFEGGRNDITGGSDTAATVVSDQTSLAASFTGLTRKYLTTVTPATSSTDSWATTGNQTAISNESVRVAYNALVRAGVAGFGGYLELADQVETARDSGIWKVDGTANKYTQDGVHLSNFANGVENTYVSSVIAGMLNYP